MKLRKECGSKGIKESPKQASKRSRYIYILTRMQGPGWLSDTDEAKGFRVQSMQRPKKHEMNLVERDKHQRKANKE